MSREQWGLLYGANATGVFLSCQAESRSILTHGLGGSIVNIASMGTIANCGLLQAHYHSAKAGVVNLSRSFAVS